MLLSSWMEMEDGELKDIEVEILVIILEFKH